jgi:hypothetical protein
MRTVGKISDTIGLYTSMKKILVPSHPKDVPKMRMRILNLGSTALTVAAITTGLWVSVLSGTGLKKR